MRTRATAVYRMPRAGQAESLRLTMAWDGITCRMAGGKWGAHQVTTSNPAAVAAHWAGYVSNNRGRQVKPAIQWGR